MSNVIVPKTRVLTGPGVLYRAPIGTLFPGQVSATVSNKAIASGVATITTSADHGYVADDRVLVSIGDSAFDGLWTLTDAPTTTTFTYAVTSADVTSAAATGTAIAYEAAGVGGTVAGSKFTDAWPTGWTPWGITREGCEFKWTPSTGNIEAAEYLLPLSIETTGVDGSLSFEVIELTASNFATALNGATKTTVSGTGATQLTRLAPPAVGAESRTMLGWEADNNSERFVIFQGFQRGAVAVAHKKGTDNAGIAMEWGIEQPTYGDPFLQFYAGSTAGA